MRYADDLVAIWLATAAILAAIVALPYGTVRVALGLLFVLFSPGYSLVAALYPRRNDLEGVERVALSLGLSLAVVPLIGLGLNFTPWGVRLTPIAVSLAAFIAASSIAAVRRRAALAPHERFSADIRPVIRRLGRLPWPAIIVSSAIAAAVLVLGFRLGVLGRSQVGEALTEFYVLGPEGKATGYPARLRIGQRAEVILGVINHEGRTATYTIQVRAGDNVLHSLAPLTLYDGQKWEQRIGFAPKAPGRRVKVEFLLFLDDALEPHRNLHLWLEVDAPDRSGAMTGQEGFAAAGGSEN